MIARNFLEHHANLFYPQIDMAGNQSGIAGAEFPFFNYLIYGVAKIFGYAHWYGRLINLIVSSFGLFYFFKIVKSLINKQIAFNATIILAASIWFGFSRKIMPDTFSASLVLIGLFYGIKYLQNKTPLNLLPFFIFSTLGMLCKIPSFAIFSGLAVIVFIKTIPLNKKIILTTIAFFSFLIVCLWYFYWDTYLVNTFHYQLHFATTLREGVKEIIPLIPDALKRFYFSSLYSYIGFVCFLMGIVYVIKSKNRLLIITISIISFSFLIFIIKTGAIFPEHNYYIIPFTPVMALITGFFLTKIPFKYQYILLSLIVIEGVANQQHGFFIKKNQQYKLSLAKIDNSIIAKNKLIIINGGQSPQSIYFANRKGWTASSENIAKPFFVDSLITLGARYLIIDKSTFKKNIKNRLLVYDDKNYLIYQLK